MQNKHEIWELRQMQALPSEDGYLILREVAGVDRKETTSFLSRLLIRDRFSGAGKYWASEVSIDPWSSGGKRVDFMQFVPHTQCAVSDIEKGIFICYEVKSCGEDVYSGNGLNFLGEKNYIVTTMQCYKDVLCPDMRSGKFWKHLREVAPESSNAIGIMVAVPLDADIESEFENTTDLDAENTYWRFKVVIPCRQGLRKRSLVELLFCMLRSGRT